MKRTFLLASLSVAVSTSAQQVSRNVVVEHFTNTYCAPCASRNPDLYDNLAAHPDIYHISYHPSAPYPSCTLHQHNAVENDARTNFYNVYGSTPRLVLQGTALPANVQFSNPGLFSSAAGLSSFNISAAISLINDSTLRLTVNIAKVDTSSLTMAGLYAAIAEDTLDFMSNNGEAHHYNVFRRSVWGDDTIMVPLPISINQSVSLMKDILVHDDWDLSKVYALVMLHDGLRIEQVAKSNGLVALSVQSGMEQAELTVYPNPAGEYLQLRNAEAMAVDIISLDGKSLIRHEPYAGPINISALPPGMYLVRVSNRESMQYARFIKQ